MSDLVEAMARQACVSRGEVPDEQIGDAATPRWRTYAPFMRVALDALLSPEGMAIMRRSGAFAVAKQHRRFPLMELDEPVAEAILRAALTAPQEPAQPTPSTTLSRERRIER